jgi:hypothetical protein
MAARGCAFAAQRGTMSAWRQSERAIRLGFMSLVRGRGANVLFLEAERRSVRQV